ncbi:hypothetical protein AAA799E16_01787 [Marine Group I thaumarchaeote SCGC AAA799-E16]|uniref:Uncharacterized protein n=4 Tax=Marine Group I TaxID=905826 RepID=A0A081RL97_9ARCH|nr:hypothetical protein AAA799N04_01605 [Marine Group I thaumarchaeote SCGC AAA799-N04]KER05548.1 hypothetical protein AAA799E16_01787 [Marine Group I thaumarchaeote SCGC AAA799-E16]KFM15617.1 hypothetical protein AAA799D11_01136 [Marine Group I thaumarchaeote SCGC AAA799-D11]KFM15780.1 hypothetical protein SCCGRSA3_02575 [Marine Group I thaumarchaeote SCGC RSA3]
MREDGMTWRVEYLEPASILHREDNIEEESKEEELQD